MKHTLRLPLMTCPGVLTAAEHQLKVVSTSPVSLEAGGVRRDQIPAPMYAIQREVKVEGAEPGDTLEVRIIEVPALLKEGTTP